jgi:hypothetical protein
MSEGRTNVTSMYERSSSGRLPSATASVGLLEPFDSEDWNVGCVISDGSDFDCDAFRSRYVRAFGVLRKG